MEYRLIDIKENDRYMQDKMDVLLEKAGLRRDAHLDYTAGIVDDNYQLMAVGSCALNTLRCIAVDPESRGEGLLNTLVSRLTEVQLERRNTHIFVYTKLSSAAFFRSLGYREIARVDGDLVFMENKVAGFSSYLKRLGPPQSEASAAIVMNANPMTRGHLHLIRQAAQERFLHVFVVAEDVSDFSFETRFSLVREECAKLPNVAVHSTGPYLISSATFPAYFLSEDKCVTAIQARLDAEVFSRIADTLSIKKRFLGQEPFSPTTCIYNQVLQQQLPPKGIEVCVIPRLEIDGQAISASRVREAIKIKDMDFLRLHLPESSFRCVEQQIYKSALSTAVDMSPTSFK